MLIKFRRRLNEHSENFNKRDKKKKRRNYGTEVTGLKNTTELEKKY